MNVPLLDLRAQYATIRAEIDAAIQQVLESQQFILGPAVAACEPREERPRRLRMQQEPGIAPARLRVRA